jgi:hypothetical protein
MCSLSSGLTPVHKRRRVKSRLHDLPRRSKRWPHVFYGSRTGGRKRGQEGNALSSPFVFLVHAHSLCCVYDRPKKGEDHNGNEEEEEAEEEGEA